MAARSSAILRSALAAHISLSATSLICSGFGTSHLSSTPTEEELQHEYNNITTAAGALPWLDQLHNLVASMYVGGGINNCCCTTATANGQQNNNTVSMVKLGTSVEFENPLVAYAGVGEIERAFKGRVFLHPQSDVKTILECINVESSSDSICGGDDTDGTDNSSRQHVQNSLMGIIPSPTISPSSLNVPNIKITYRLSQQYGSYFSVNSLLVVTVQVCKGCPEKVHQITSSNSKEKSTIPLATSGITPRAASSVAIHSGPASVALAKAASKWLPGGQHSDAVNNAHSLTVAEVVRIEEQWNGVQLLNFAPFHWSRRLNGLVAGSAAYFFF